MSASAKQIFAVLVILGYAAGVAGPMDYAADLERDAQEKVARAERARGPGWSHTEHHRLPAKLADCDRLDRLVLSGNSGAYAPWQRFCWRP